jgi:broad specificity phosphatase PhoE
MAERLAGESLDLCVVTEFGRAQATAEIVLADRPLEILVMPEFNETTFGRFEGEHWWDGYHHWAMTTGPLDTCPGGGESRVSVIGRICSGYEALLQRPEHTILLVAHGCVLRYAIDARDGKTPQPHVHGVPAAHQIEFSSAEVSEVVRVLRDWLRTPSWTQESGF